MRYCSNPRCESWGCANPKHKRKITMATQGTAVDFFELLKLIQDDITNKGRKQLVPKDKILFVFSPIEIYVGQVQRAIGVILDKPFVEPISGMDSNL